ncbi:PIN domain-containing protein [Saliphagus infecundisoli]|uniref:PIN domain-containing protein n=1 Tax=Saliphagus infecundisoli TaxID=1849069 RepID=A0ABD5Q980_9EURY|nr:PIN domain-containing protein [Saliphagus infecundisoli]
MRTYVFDTEPIIAWLHEEPGHERVDELLEEATTGESEGIIADANAAEIVYLNARLLAASRGDTKPITRDIAEGLYDITMLERAGIRIEDASWEQAGRIKAPGGLSLGDAFAVTQACDDDATLVVGADDDFENLPVSVEILQFRDESA